MLLARRQTLFHAKLHMSFISGSSNYRLSALKDHDNSACHQRVIREKEHEEAVAVGKSLPRKIQRRPLTSESPII